MTQGGHKMNWRFKRIGWVVFALSLICFSTAWADGGTEPAATGCGTLPQPTELSPLITGHFTAVPWKLEGQAPKQYDIHVVLKRMQWINGKEEKIIRLYAFRKDIVEQKSLCEYTECEIVQKYLFSPCNRDAEKLFDIKGIPVLTELKVLAKDNCGDPENTMIYGSFKIRVVPAGN